ITVIELIPTPGKGRETHGGRPVSHLRCGAGVQRMPHLTASKFPRIPVAVLCATALLREGLEAVVRAAPDLCLWAPEAAGQPHRVLGAAESGAGLQVLRESALPVPGRRAVLLDTAGRLGPRGAGLHGFLGYLPPEADADRLHLCLRRVADGQPDAPEPY